MHFTWDISFGQVIVSIPILWLIGIISRMYAMMLRFRIEHEELMVDWCNRQTPPKNLMDLPTRKTRWW